MIILYGSEVYAALLAEEGRRHLERGGRAKVTLLKFSDSPFVGINSFSYCFLLVTPSILRTPPKSLFGEETTASPSLARQAVGGLSTVKTPTLISAFAVTPFLESISSDSTRLSPSLYAYFASLDAFLKGSKFALELSHPSLPEHRKQPSPELVVQSSNPYSYSGEQTVELLNHEKESFLQWLASSITAAPVLQTNSKASSNDSSLPGKLRMETSSNDSSLPGKLRMETNLPNFPGAHLYIHTPLEELQPEFTAEYRSGLTSYTAPSPPSPSDKLVKIKVVEKSPPPHPSSSHFRGDLIKIHDNSSPRSSRAISSSLSLFRNSSATSTSPPSLTPDLIDTVYDKKSSSHSPVSFKVQKSSTPSPLQLPTSTGKGV